MNPENMFEPRPNTNKSPDISKLKEVIIDHRTKIYIAPDADIEEPGPGTCRGTQLRS
jgi:hypothetical protein